MNSIKTTKVKREKTCNSEVYKITQKEHELSQQSRLINSTSLPLPPHPPTELKIGLLDHFVIDYSQYDHLF